MQKPILVLQMQRMGDLILSFPLLGLLQNLYPERPVWTVAEEMFFSKLMPLAPHTTFFPPSAAPQLRTQAYHSVINLSHRPDAIALAGSVEAEHRYGAYAQNAATYINGKWSLYRASIVNNNRYNLFHWSDLYVLDHLQGRKIPPWSIQSTQTRSESTIGIFVGASEQEKRPAAAFYGELGQKLSQKGYNILFLGGPDDKSVGQEAEARSGIAGSCMCGKYSIEQLALELQKLSLFITPDTGPMHLASWVNTPILNLSLGPVNPWETGPRSARSSSNAQGGVAHHVVQPALSCCACWQACKDVSRCHHKFQAKKITELAHALLQHPHEKTLQAALENIDFRGLRVYRVGQDAQGLYALHAYTTLGSAPTSRELLAQFWQKWFLMRLHENKDAQFSPLKEYAELHRHYPLLAQSLRQHSLLLGKKLRNQLKTTLLHKKYCAHANFWQELPQILRPISSYMQFYLQNNEYSLGAWEETLYDMEELYKIVT